jgi:uncharacterized membrane protein YadS
VAPGRLPDLFWVSNVAVLAAWPGVPGSDFVVMQLEALDRLSTMTPLMAFAALGLGLKEVRLFRQAGLQFLAITVLVLFGTYIGSVAVAQIVLAFN